jgi:FeS assembly protein IscX
MPNALDWDDAESIGLALADKFPGTDPLAVRFTDLHKWVTELDGFTGDPKLSNEGKLEAIQMAWNEEYQDRLGS